VQPVVMRVTLCRADGVRRSASGEAAADPGHRVVRAREAVARKGYRPGATGGPGEEQARVAELVPQVAGLQGGVVGRLPQPRSGDRLEEEEMGGVGRVPAGEQAVDGAHRAVGPEHQVGPAPSRRHRPVAAGCGLQGAGRGGADGDHPAPRAVDVVDETCRRCGHLESLVLRCLVGLERGDPGVEQHRRDEHARAEEIDDQLPGERPAGARHLRAAAVVREDGLVGRAATGARRSRT
jgi:hypothetical protein